MKILLVDDTLTERLILRAYLEKLNHEVVDAENGHEALRAYKKEKPELILMDVIMPEMDGHEAARQLRKDDSDWVPIIFLSGKVGAEDIVAGIDAGGDDYLTKPVDFRILEAKLKAMQRIAHMRRKLINVSSELEAANKELKKQVHKDGLTGLANRRYLDHYLELELARCIRSGLPMSVVLIDVDYFKKYNDSLGHLQGDDCLRLTAAALDSACNRSTDLVARYGGEEFAAILPETSVENSNIVAENLRKSVEALHLPHPDSPLHNVTVSLGVFGLKPKPGYSVEELLDRADKALYEAKESGRNKVKVYQDT